jgi:predicted DNA-binding protein
LVWEGLQVTMLRINERTKTALRSLANERGEPMSQVVEELVEAARKEQFFAAADAAYRRLHNDPDGWAAELSARGAWESTLGDGLGDA